MVNLRKQQAFMLFKNEHFSSCYLQTLTLYIIQSWKISQILFQGLNSSLLLFVLFGFLLAFLFQATDISISGFKLKKKILNLQGLCGIKKIITKPTVLVKATTNSSKIHFNSSILRFTFLQIFISLKSRVLCLSAFTTDGIYKTAMGWLEMMIEFLLPAHVQTWSKLFPPLSFQQYVHVATMC